MSELSEERAAYLQDWPAARLRSPRRRVSLEVLAGTLKLVDI